jgi:hypothetical protein
VSHNRTRAWRRFQRVKAIVRAVRRLHSQGLLPEHYQERWRLQVRRAAVTPSPCSGPCCGNPRHWYTNREALTMQERRAALEPCWPASS